MALLPTDSVPPHSFVDSPSSDNCFLCDLPEESPIHPTTDLDVDLDNFNAEDSAVSEDDDDVDEPGQAGVMVALFVDSDTADKLALDIEGSEPASNMHLTLAYLGKAVDLSNPEDLVATVAEFAAKEGSPLTGVIGGLGLFTGGESPVTYASADVPGLPAFRQELVQVLDAAGFAIDTLHGFTPHITLAFGDERNVTVPNLPLTFSTITVAIAGKRSTFQLAQPETSGVHKKHKYKHPVGKAIGIQEENFNGFTSGSNPPCAECGQPENCPDHETDAPAPQTSGYLQVMDRQEWPLLTSGDQMLTSTINMQPDLTLTNVIGDASSAPQQAFVSDINGHTLITGPAQIDQHWEKALNPNPHMMWMQGRLVGADEPNRNKAFWSTKDLEMGEGTVTHGPLNWLHESRHIIGSIADHKLVRPPQTAADGKQMPTHVAAMAGIWQWIYPDEAYVIEQASDQQKLYFSMECISENVECVGDNGCGTKVSYSQYLHGAAEGACQHMVERSAVRRFENPTFLGAAVIVPPVRPGWADADASVVREAARLAERAFVQVNPDMTASEWEALMRQVVGYGRQI